MYSWQMQYRPISKHPYQEQHVGLNCLMRHGPLRSIDANRRPVVRLLRALYGQPDAGTMWEKHCDTAVKSQEAIWESVERLGDVSKSSEY